MSFPSVKEFLGQGFSTQTTAHLINMPAMVNSGQLLLVIVHTQGTGTISTPSGWTVFYTETYTAGGGDGKAYAFSKVATGSEGGTTIDLVTSLAQTLAAQVYRIGNWFGTIATGTDYASAGSASGTTPNPPSLSPSWGAADTLWIAACHSGDDDETASVFPASYINGVSTVSGAPANLGSAVLSATRTLNAVSENPGAFTLTGSEGTIAFTIGVRPGTSGSEPAVLNQPIISGVVSLAGTLLNEVIPTIDLTKSIIFTGVGAIGTADIPEETFFTAELTSSTNARFQRDTASSSLDIYYRIAEFASGVTVQRGVTDFSVAVDIGDRYAITETITAVDLAKTFPIITMRNGTALFSGNEPIIVTFPSTTQIRLGMDDNPALPSSIDIAWQVVSFSDNTTVQNITGSMAGGVSSATRTITSVDLSKSMVILTYGHSNNGGGNADDILLSVKFNSSIQIQLDRVGSLEDIIYSIFVVEFDGAVVETDLVTVTGGNSSVGGTFGSAIDDANAVYFMGGIFGYAGTSTNVGAVYNSALGAVTARPTSTTFTLTTGDRTTSDREFFVQGIEFLYTPPASSFLGPTGGIGVGSPFIF